MPESLNSGPSNFALTHSPASSRFHLTPGAWAELQTLVNPGSGTTAELLPYAVAGGEATGHLSNVLVAAAIAAAPMGTEAPSCTRHAGEGAGREHVWPSMSLDQIAALTQPKNRALALTFVAIDRNCPKARALVRSVNVPEAGSDGQAVQAKLLPPPPKKKRGKRLSKPVCLDSALKPFFPYLFNDFPSDEAMTLTRVAAART